MLIMVDMNSPFGAPGRHSQYPVKVASHVQISENNVKTADCKKLEKILAAESLGEGNERQSGEDDRIWNDRRIH